MEFERKRGDSPPDTNGGSDDGGGCYEGGDEDDENQKLMENKPTVTDPDSDADKDVKSVKAIDYYEKMLKVKWDDRKIIWDLG